MNLDPLLDLPAVADGLSRIDAVLRDAVRCGDGFLDEVVCHLIDAGGKRVRPALALAAATAGDRRATGDDLLGGVCVELVHLASLYHDDVMDEATMRRNVPSVNARWGNLVAIVAGDYLLARSAEIAAGLGAEIAGLLARTLGDLCRGQVTEVQAAYRTDRSEADYLATIDGKTAALMATSCRIGALTAGLPPEEVEALTRFGQRFGMVFQLRDDVLDVIGTEAELGKPAGQDLAEGIYTLPVLLALADPDEGPTLAPLLGRPLGATEREVARQRIAASSGIDRALAVGRRLADEASQAAADIGDGDLAAALATLPELLWQDMGARCPVADLTSPAPSSAAEVASPH